jgi:hypothetical protein
MCSVSFIVCVVFLCCVSFDRGVILCDVLFVCCVLLYNHCQRVETHLHLINITSYKYYKEYSPYLCTRYNIFQNYNQIEQKETRYMQYSLNYFYIVN